MDPPFSPAVSTDDIEHFKSMPWCATHLTAPNLIVRRPWNRKPGPGMGDTLYAVTFNTPYTVPSILMFYPDPDVDVNPAADRKVIPELKAFFTLGPMIAGFPGVCHGGVVMTIFDEVLSYLIKLNRGRGAIKGDSWMMTAYLNTTFLKPVQVPNTYLVTASIDKVEGRKAFGSLWLEGEDGVKLAKAEGLFVMVREKL